MWFHTLMDLIQVTRVLFRLLSNAPVFSLVLVFMLSYIPQLHIWDIVLSPINTPSSVISSLTSSVKPALSTALYADSTPSFLTPSAVYP
ncbi:hypothetical protein NLI96_g11770 [Meripilus lineatus]|uniref:Uncharacterized protein n=1 Tax=Meripilus lineatus TaxID=2056292 RepID=A0AAD5UR64_9APHY|nr:hypothetical protein NLI96_g11770 [Physisporinus lineatus]